ncbi:AAA family ATPase [Dactylosporangium sp. NPDC051541]|uniref:AAA family ATPase n=1 Tax=Dactylosporangium sp. NPDC051541 TaxID=3363977 RepID=UPI0037A56BF3
MIRRYVLTGAPGAGKTTLAEALQARGHTVIREAATDVIHEAPELEGTGQPFLERILRTQLERQAGAGGALQVFDRSPACTLALAEYCGIEPQAELRLAAANDGTYQRRVFFVRLMGFIVPTKARRIGLADSERFERIHRDVYRRLGYELVEVPPGTVGERVALVEEVIGGIG